MVGPAYTDATLGLIRPVTRFTYNALGFLVRVEAGRTDVIGTNVGADQVTLQMSATFDDFGRKITETDALDRQWQFNYDRHGNLIKKTDPQSQVTNFT